MPNSFLVNMALFHSYLMCKVMLLFKGFFRLIPNDDNVNEPRGNFWSIRLTKLFHLRRVHHQLLPPLIRIQLRHFFVSGSNPGADFTSSRPTTEAAKAGYFLRKMKKIVKKTSRKIMLNFSAVIWRVCKKICTRIILASQRPSKIF